MLKPLLRSPAAAMAALALVAFALVAAAALWLSHLPGASLHVRPAPGGMARVEPGGLYREDAVASFIDRQGRTRLAAPLAVLMLDREPRGAPTANDGIWAARGAVSRLLREPGMRLRLPDGRMVPARAIPGSIRGMKPGVWLSLGIGLCATLIGIWVLSLRPREWAARMFALSGLALMGATITIAFSEQQSLAASVTAQEWAQHVNHLCADVFGLSLASLFARYPFPLVSRRWLALASGLCAMLWAASLFEPWTDMVGMELSVVLLLGASIVGLALAQAWMSRHDPALRAAFILIGASLAVCDVLFSAANLIPQLLGRPDIVSVPLSTTGFLLFYLSLAVAIARFRLFDLGGWALGAAMAALVAITVLIADFALVTLTGAGWTLSITFLAATICWLPLREWLLRKGDRKRRAHDMSLLRGAGEVAFAVRPEHQASRWHALLEARFAPLRLEPADCQKVEIRGDGRMLAIPSPLGGTGVELGFAAQGSRLFNSEDRAEAAALVALVRELTAARAAYERGVQAERHRIARDLHDDVGSRLMTTLHRDDLTTVHADVREAMADIRLIIDGMAGQTRQLADILADLRHETVSRLGLAKIPAIWPVDDLFDEERPLAAVQNRALYSVVRELVSNIIRHARASEVRVAASLDGDRLSLLIHDNGRGFDMAGSADAGNGLRNIRKRLEEIGGSIAMTSDGHGTSARVVLPLGSHEHGMALHG